MMLIVRRMIYPDVFKFNGKPMPCGIVSYRIWEGWWGNEDTAYFGTTCPLQCAAGVLERALAIEAKAAVSRVPTTGREGAMEGGDKGRGLGRMEDSNTLDAGVLPLWGLLDGAAVDTGSQKAVAGAPT